MGRTASFSALLLGILSVLNGAMAFYRAPASCVTTSRIAPGVRPRDSPRAFVVDQQGRPSIHGDLLTWEDIEQCAADFGLTLSLTTLGPFYRIVARKVDDGEALGYTSGFVAPLLGLVHLDTMQIRRRYWKQLDAKNRFRYGLGVLLGAMAMRHAYDCGCKKAELLAINDDDKMHAMLVHFYTRAGFVKVKEVTNEVSCIPDLLVWGGVGTRMDMGVEDYLRRWCSLIRSRGVEFSNAQPQRSLAAKETPRL